jgi:hypothetical protein
VNKRMWGLWTPAFVFSRSPQAHAGVHNRWHHLAMHLRTVLGFTSYEHPSSLCYVLVPVLGKWHNMDLP